MSNAAITKVYNYEPFSIPSAVSIAWRVFSAQYGRGLLGSWGRTGHGGPSSAVLCGRVSSVVGTIGFEVRRAESPVWAIGVSGFVSQLGKVVHLLNVVAPARFLKIPADAG